MNPTAEQIEYLLDFLEENRVLALGRSRTISGRAQVKLLWEQLTNKLNSLGGCKKSIKQWQKVWADKKYAAKKAAGLARQQAVGTGGGPPSTPTLTISQNRIIDIMGRGFGEPQTEARVAAFPNVIETSEPAELQASSQSQLRSPNRTRSSRRLADHSVRSRLFRIEEDRVAAERQSSEELRRIREALTEMCGLMRELISSIKNKR